MKLFSVLLVSQAVLGHGGFIHGGNGYHGDNTLGLNHGFGRTKHCWDNKCHPHKGKKYHGHGGNWIHKHRGGNFPHYHPYY